MKKVLKSLKKISSKSENINQLKEISSWFLRDTDGNLDATRFHSFGIGAMDGVDYHRKGYRLEFWINNHADVAYKPHYYDLGYFLGSKPKWALFGALVYVYGPQILVML